MQKHDFQRFLSCSARFLEDWSAQQIWQSGVPIFFRGSKKSRKI